MKRFITMLLLSVPFVMMAQTEIDIQNTRRLMSKGEQPGFLVRIPGSALPDAEKAWMKEIRKGNKVKPSKSREEIAIQQAVLGTIRSDAMNVYARFYQDSKDVLLYAFFEIDSVFFDGTENPDLSGNIRNYLRDFAIGVYRESFGKVVKDEEKVLTGLEKSVASLEAQNKKADRGISKNERRISDLQQRIREITGDEDRKSAEIERQKNLIATLDNFPEEQKAARTKLRSLEKERKQMKRKRESAHKQVDKLEEGIKSMHRTIRINGEKMKQSQLNIDQQRAKLLEMTNKLSNIR